MFPISMFCMLVVVAVFGACTSSDATNGTTPKATDASSSNQGFNCGTLTNVGICDGTTVTWCESGAVKSANCKAAGYAGCQLVSGIYDCYGMADDGLKTCLASCSTGCDKLPCYHKGPAAIQQCALDRANCQVGCRCDCASSIKPSNADDATACSTSCQHKCKLAASKCQVSCGANNACAAKCNSQMASCLSAGISVCF